MSDLIMFISIMMLTSLIITFQEHMRSRKNLSNIKKVITEKYSQYSETLVYSYIMKTYKRFLLTKFATVWFIYSIPTLIIIYLSNLI